MRSIYEGNDWMKTRDHSPILGAIEIDKQGRKMGVGFYARKRGKMLKGTYSSSVWVID